MSYHPHHLNNLTMLSGYAEEHMSSNPTYTSTTSTPLHYPHGYDSIRQPTSPQPLDLSISRVAGRGSPHGDSEGGPARASPRTPPRYSPYCSQAPSPTTQSTQRTSPTAYITQRTSPVPYINQRTSPTPRVTQRTESPYLYHELYTASNVLNEMPCGNNVLPVSSVLPVSRQYEESDVPLTRPTANPHTQAILETHSTRGHDSDDQVIIMDLEPPAQNFINRGNNSDNYSCSKPVCQFSLLGDPKAFPSCPEKIQEVCPQPAPLEHHFRPDSSSDVSPAPLVIRQPPSRTLPSTSPSSNAANYKSYKTAVSRRTPIPSPRASPKTGTRSPQTTWFQNQSSACFMVQEQLCKLGRMQQSNISDLDERGRLDCLVNIMFADVKSCCREIERFERDGVPKIRMPMHRLIETQVEEILRV